MTTLPTIPDVTIFLDESRDYPALIVTAPKAALTKQIVALCHRVAGDNGATVEFRS